jgi:AcrR family transcriptional regulator
VLAFRIVCELFRVRFLCAAARTRVVAMGFRGERAQQYDPATDALRLRLLDAAKALLSEANASFSFDLVASRAGVARSTLQHQFRSQAGLLEALFDHLSVESRARVRTQLAREGAADAIDAYVEEIAQLWEEQRVVIRRLRALAAFDQDLAAALATRDEHRREGLLRLVRGDSARAIRSTPKSQELVERLFALTNFETLDALAGPTRTIVSVVAVVRELARAAQRPS